MSIDPAEWVPLVCKASRLYGAGHLGLDDSEQFGDGMLGLAEAIRTYPLAPPGTAFKHWAWQRACDAIHAGRRRQRGKAGTRRRLARRVDWEEVDRGEFAVDARLPDLDGPSERAARSKAVDELLSALPPQTRRMLTRHAMEGMGCREIGRLESPPVSFEAVKKRVDRARRRLRREFPHLEATP